MNAGALAINPCTHCGFCLPACPTYRASGDELRSPRGRLVLLRGLLEQQLAVEDDALLPHLGSCTLCAECEPACPSGVRFTEGYRAAQQLLAEHQIRLEPADAPA